MKSAAECGETSSDSATRGSVDSASPPAMLSAAATEPVAESGAATNANNDAATSSLHRRGFARDVRVMITSFRSGLR
ncbi:hypothetical protein, partial [Streptomyces sp. MP131-18]|uniref:hypothetical protein n=1 Tax=Streptomyces sp. MP131-18 TaxID=1857892 RepID=UPI001C0CBA55